MGKKSQNPGERMPQKPLSGIEITPEVFEALTEHRRKQTEQAQSMRPAENDYSVHIRQQQAFEQQQQQAARLFQSESNPAPVKMANQKSAESKATLPYPATNENKLKNNEMRRKKIIRVGKRAGIAAGVVLVGGLVTANAGTIGNLFQASNATVEAENGVGIIDSQNLRVESLGPEQCTDPNAVFMVAEITGYIPLVPMLPENTPPYLTEEIKNTLPEELKSEFAKYITNDGSPHMYVQDMPMAMSICEPLGSQATTQKGDKVTKIVRTDLNVMFEDPNSLFQRTDLVNLLYPVVNTESVDLDPSNGLYGAIQDTTRFLAPKEATEKGYDAYNQALTVLNDNMGTQAQNAAILDMLKRSLVKQLDSDVDGQENITYADGGVSLREAIDLTLEKRFASGDDITFEGSYYNVGAITNPSLPVGLDSNQEFVISKVTVKEGKLSTPDKPIPDSNPTPSPEPATAP